MFKQFLSIEEQVALLEDRGVATDEATPHILLREGYYAVVNGYGKAFLDEVASQAAQGDRFVAGTTFHDIYQLFLCDRELRSVTFRALMCVEATLRSVLAHTFTEHHKKPASYLRRGCFCTAGEYLGERDRHERDLTWLINTLERTANGIQDDAEGGSYDDQRIAWYRSRYDEVPLWVLFSDLTFGNLRYFFALMRRSEQRVVCARLHEVCGPTMHGQPLSPKGLLDDLEALGDLRNDCAHEARVYNASFGQDKLTYTQVLRILVAYLAPDDEKRLRAEVDEVVARFANASPRVASALSRAGLQATHHA